MATRYGHDIGRELVLHHGWKWDDSPLPADYCGDQHLIDPQTGVVMTAYQALEIQRERSNTKSICEFYDS